MKKQSSDSDRSKSCIKHKFGRPTIDHPIPFLVTACLQFLTAVAATSYFGGVISTLEKQFQFDSKMSGLIGIITDASSFSSVLFITYYGSKSNQPRIIGIGAIVSSLGYFCCAVPHFFNDNYQYKGMSTNDEQQNTGPLCNVTLGNNSAEEILETVYVEKDMSGIAWLCIGNLLIGFGTSPLFPLTLTYLDDSTIDPSTTSIYIGTFMSMTSFGPLLGFFTSYKCLSLYVDFERFSVEDKPLGFRDPTWLGAWWLGYLCASALMLLLSLPMFFFPRHLTKHECQICSRMIKDDGKNEDIMVGISFRMFNESSILANIVGFVKAMKRLIMNPVLTSVLLVSTCDIAIIGGFIFFVAKYIQVQFNVAPAITSIIVGLTTAPGNIAGNVISSFIIKRLKLKLRGLSIMVVSICLTAACLSIPVLFIGCTNPEIAGVTVHYENHQQLSLPVAAGACNQHCSCSNGVYEPVCGADGVTYLSPCHAGCTTRHNDIDNNKMNFSDCACIGQSYTDSDFPAATEGVCNFVCDKTFVFALFVAIISTFASMRTNPCLMATLRSVNDEDRGMAMGYQSLVVRALGFLPASLYFGAAISSTCLYRQETDAGNGACLIYDLEQYRFGFIGTFVALKVLGAIFACFFFFSVKLWKIPRDNRIKNLDSQTHEDYSASDENTETLA
ncbi:solute carrier organic anion transporter family member 2A1-like isoform X2 [Antedon mediterranea]|uniref:solute carrier organic anion transporter family member 2A1-like isoform X2 n=1 Tax=Antedon mediterranea TaxID=105859 RepID=UPI003AF43D6E